MTDGTHHSPASGHSGSLPPASASQPKVGTIASLEVLATSDKPIVLFGGSFDPPHLAHTHLAARARDVVPGPDATLVVVPAAQSPFKDEKPTSPEHRLAMLKRALRSVPHALLWTEELDRAKADPASRSYWIDTLRKAVAQLTNHQQITPEPEHNTPSLFFLLGSDQVVSFHRWHKAREILSLATPIVLLRKPCESAAQLRSELTKTGAWSEAHIDTWIKCIAPVPIEPISATDIRTLITTCWKTTDTDMMRQELRGLLDPEVIEYIVANRLYQ